MFYAIIGRTGAVRWKFGSIDGEGGYIHSQTAAIGPTGNVYFSATGYAGGWRTYLYSVHGATGMRLWRSEEEVAFEHVRLNHQGDVIATLGGTGKDHSLTLFSKSGSRPLWTASPDLKGLGGASTAADGTVYANASPNKVVAINGSTGRLIWQVELPGLNLASSRFTRLLASMFSSRNSLDFNSATTVMVGPNSTLYMGGYDGVFYALDAADGSVKWQYTPDMDFDDPVSASSPSLGIDDSIVFVDIGGSVTSLDLGSGKVKWRVKIDDFGWTSTAIAGDGTAYYASSDGHLYALNGSTGAVIWKLKLSDEGLESSPAIDSDGTVYVVGGDRRLYAIR